MNITIREATKDDADVDAMVAMAYALHDHHRTCDGRSRHVHDEGATRKELLEVLDAAESRVLLALDEDGRIVGMAIGKIREREGHEPPVAGYIRKVFVNESHRGRGVARQLLRDLMTFFGVHGIEMIDLHYLTRNASAEKFWTHLGFEPFLMNARTTLAELAKNL